MDPEQRLFIIVKHLAVEFFIIFLAALIRMFCPKRLCIADGYRPFHDLCLLNRLFVLFALFWLFRNLFYNRILFCYFLHRDRLIFRLSISLCKEYLHRHKRAIFIQNFSYPVLIGKFITVFIQMQDDLSSYTVFVTAVHGKCKSAIRLPVYGLCTFFIGKCVNLR